MEMTPIDELHLAASEALQAETRLLIAWRKIAGCDATHLFEPGDLALLTELLKQRIFPLNAFAAICKIDKESAIQLLLTYYLGDAVDPDTKFGGYSFELSCLLDDLREAHGEAALRELISNARFNRNRFDDRRVIDAFAEALNLNTELFLKSVS